MDILEVLKKRIIKLFPEITDSELRERLLIAEKLLKQIDGN